MINENKIIYKFLESLQKRKSVVRTCIDSNKTSFWYGGDCEVCDKQNVNILRMSGHATTCEGEGFETSVVWCCFECYKQKMRMFGDSEKKMFFAFNPEFVFDIQIGGYLTIIENKVVIAEFLKTKKKDSELKNSDLLELIESGLILKRNDTDGDLLLLRVVDTGRNFYIDDYENIKDFENAVLSELGGLDE